MRKLLFGVLIGTGIAYFARFRGAFSTVSEPSAERLPDLERVRDREPERRAPAAEPTAGDPEDARLVDRVKTQVLGDERFKGHVNVTAEYGRVVLHGELENPDLVEELVARVREVDGVRDVDARLHLPHVESELPRRPSGLEERF